MAPALRVEERLACRFLRTSLPSPPPAMPTHTQLPPDDVHTAVRGQIHTGEMKRHITLKSVIPQDTSIVSQLEKYKPDYSWI